MLTLLSSRYEALDLLALYSDHLLRSKAILRLASQAVGRHTLGTHGEHASTL